MSNHTIFTYAYQCENKGYFSTTIVKGRIQFGSYFPDWRHDPASYVKNIKDSQMCVANELQKQKLGNCSLILENVIKEVFTNSWSDKKTDVDKITLTV